MSHRWLLTLYPRAWRARYGEEVSTLIANQPLRPGLVLDILAGAIDAHLAQQWGAASDKADSSTQKGAVMKLLTLRCAGTLDLSPGTQVRLAIGTIATTLAIVVFYAGIKRALGDNLFVEALGISVFPMALIVGTMPMYLRQHSIVAQIVLIAVLLTLAYLASLLAAWV